MAATLQTLGYAAIAMAQRSCPSMNATRYPNLILQLVPFGPIRVLCDTLQQHPAQSFR